MTFRHLEIFLSVCESKSMTEAAKKLFISQPAVSLAIREIEMEYDMQLFDRSSRTLSLTDIGFEIYAYVKRIWSLVDDMKLVVTEKKAYSSLRIGTGIVFGELFLPHILQKFKQLHRGCDIFVVVEGTEVIEPLLANGELDLCITEGVSDSPKLEHRELSHAPLVAVCHKDHPFAQEEVVTAEMLASESLLLRERNSPTREAVEVYFANRNLSVRPAWESISALALLTAAATKSGIAILPYDHFATLAVRDLVLLQVEHLDCTRHIDFIYRKNMTLSPLAEEFIAFTLSFIRELKTKRYAES